MKTEKHIISLTAEEQIISLTDDLHDAYDTIRGLEIELEKCQMSDKSDAKSAERPTYRTTGLRVAMYAAKLNESVTELERENAALRAALTTALGIEAIDDESLSELVSRCKSIIDAAREEQK